jgi:hypothetical protein
MIRDVFDATNNYPYVAPNFNLWYMQFHRFIQPPPDIAIDINSYSDLRTLWNTDVHLNCTYCFLSDEERRLFALNEQSYLIKQVYEQIFYNVTGSQIIELNSNGMVPAWMFYFQRSDSNTRNQWSNYSNFPYETVPNYITPAPNTVVIGEETYDGPGTSPENLYCTIIASSDNVKNVLVNMAILLDGSYRENSQGAGIFNYIGKYVQTPGAAPEGLYVYNFCNDTGSFLQPSGAINMSHFHTIQLEFNTIYPPLNYLAQSTAICDPETKQIIGTKLKVELEDIIGSGTIGQVYKGIYKDKNVAIKVKHPNIEKNIENYDLFINMILKILNKVAGTKLNIDLKDFYDGVRNQLDFVNNRIKQIEENHIAMKQLNNHRPKTNLYKNSPDNHIEYKPQKIKRRNFYEFLIIST